MGRTRLLVLLATSFLLTGCLLRGGSATLADLEVAYTEAQDAIAQAESIGADESAPQLLELAQNRLEEVRENQLGAPSQDVLREYRYVKTLAQRAVTKTLKNRVDQLSGKLEDLEESSPDTVIRKVPQTPSNQESDLGPDPVARWSFDGDTGVSVSDPIGNYEGQRVGGTRSGLGVKGRAIILENDQGWVEIPKGASLTPRRDFSVSLWFYPTQQKQQFLINKGPLKSADGPSPFSLFLTQNGDIAFAVNTVEGFSQIRSVGYELQRWHHVVATYDGNAIELFVDGEKVSGLPIENALSVNDSPLVLGALPGGEDVLEGRLDEVKLYGEALDAYVIKDLYQQSR
jgi:hypothetical protein